MTERDLDIAIEKCERIMEIDTRTMQNPVSENGHIFEKVYELLKFLRQLQFATDTNVATTDTISREAAVEAMRKAKDKSEAHRMLIQMPPAQPDHIGEVTEMVGDAVSRQGVLRLLNAVPSEEFATKAMLISGVNALPPAQPGWIPVTEKCPEIGQIVLCSLKTRHYYGRIHVCRYRAADKYYDHPYFDWDHNGFPDVVAWMPLPKPWEGENNG